MAVEGVRATNDGQRWHNVYTQSPLRFHTTALIISRSPLFFKCGSNAAILIMVRVRV